MNRLLLLAPALVFPLLPPFLPHFPSPHPGIQGHHGRGDTGPLAQDTGYRGHFYLWISKNWTNRYFLGISSTFLWRKRQRFFLFLSVNSLMMLINLIKICNFWWRTLPLGRGARGRGGRLGNKQAPSQAGNRKDSLLQILLSHLPLPKNQKKSTALKSLIFFEAGLFVSAFPIHCIAECTLCTHLCANCTPEICSGLFSHSCRFDLFWGTAQLNVKNEKFRVDRQCNTDPWKNDNMCMCWVEVVGVVVMVKVVAVVKWSGLSSGHPLSNDVWYVGSDMILGWFEGHILEILKRWRTDKQTNKQTFNL